ncbi:uncharacterized protein [Aegilops tauschii subsp. strangulata]|uniref:uncharacterized protein n=1 Tax=Aegilops tauschii subsp. strangulata TaxID=200361 RepID=UPI003CC8BFD0
MYAILSSVRVECPHEGCGLYNSYHKLTITRACYGKVLQLQVPVSEPRLLLFAEEDGRAYFLVGSALDIGAPIAVTDPVKVEIKVTSSMDPGNVAMQELTFFIVLPKLLVGDGLSRTLSLHIQIDKLIS